jgi:thioesterase domain-containing protein/acyl carrier protein
LNGANPRADYVAPRTPMEEALAKIWIDVLRLRQVGVHDDFFALGGHSLLAMRLIGEVRKSINSKISVAEFFRTPTVEGMANVIHEGSHIETEDEQREFRLVLREGTKSLAHIPENARLVALQATHRSVRPPFFVVNSYPYFIDVVKLLDADQPVLSLVAKEAMEESSNYDLVREAAAHVETILEYAPHGPYRVGGFCASGIVAYEVAQQLVDRRHDVELLVLFDTVNPHFMKDYSPFRRSVVFNWPALKGTRWVDLPKWLMSKGANLIAKKLDRFAGTQARSEELSLTSDEFEFSTRFGFSPVRIAAARKYRPKPYNGNFLLFKSHRQLGGRYLDPHLGWGGTVSGRSVVTQLSTNEHLEIFKSAFDRALVAQELRRAFEEVPAIISSADPTKGNGSVSESRVS